MSDIGFDVGDTRRWWNPSGNWTDQTVDRLAGYNTVLPEQLLDSFSQISKEGLYGESGIRDILKGTPQESALMRMRLQSLLKRKFGKRLGARAGGAADVGFMNQVLAPTFERELGLGRELRQKNIESKLVGLQGGQDIFSMLSNMYGNLYMNKEQDETGALDYVNAISQMIRSGASIATGGGGA